MNEDFLHYVWQYHKFDRFHLKTSTGEELNIIQKGKHNTSNSGPDFQEALLEIGGQKWAGQVEIHLKSSDWYAHRHETDPRYDNVILHVVWEHDVEVYDAHQKARSTLVISDYVEPKALTNYKKLLLQDKKKWINCERDFHSFSEFSFQNWLERVYIERLEEKSKRIDKLLTQTQNHWDAVCFLFLAQNFGLNVNGHQFLNIAQSFDYKILQKLNKNQSQIEALIFGQAGLLMTEAEDIYIDQLKNDFRFLKDKYQLKPRQEKLEYFRLRPSNFPTIRLAQISALMAKSDRLCASLMQIDTLEKARSFFKIEVSEFWKTHYTFEKESKKTSKKLSRSFIDLLMINAVIPLKFSYLKHKGQLDFDKDIFNLINDIKPERNSIVKKFEMIRDHKIDSAMQTQALLHLKKNYCDLNRCLNCNFGLKLLKE